MAVLVAIPIWQWSEILHTKSSKIDVLVTHSCRCELRTVRQRRRVQLLLLVVHAIAVDVVCHVLGLRVSPLLTRDHSRLLPMTAWHIDRL